MAEINIVWGGYFASVYTETVCQDPSIDYVISGQGEQALSMLIDAVKNNKSFDSVPGLCQLDSDRQLVRQPPGPMIRSDRFGLAPYERLDMSKYAAKTFLGNRTFNHHSSQGCPYV